MDRLRGAARSSSHRRHDSPSEAWTVELCLPGGGAQCLAVDPEAHGSRTDSKTHDCEKSLKPSVDGFKKLRHPRLKGNADQLIALLLEAFDQQPVI